MLNDNLRYSHRRNRFNLVQIAAVAIMIIFVLLPAIGQITRPRAQSSSGFHETTLWRIKPSEAFDALCLLNTLTADSFYLEYYRGEYDKFAPKLTPEVKEALADLKRKIKDEHKNIISAYLCLYFSATDDSTLNDLIKTLAKPAEMQNRLKATPYYSEEEWRLFESVRADLDIIFGFLKSIGFDDYWQEKILPQAKAKIKSIENELTKCNIVPLIEGELGFPLTSNEVIIFMLYYSQPHGIRITGTRFLTDVAWPFKIVMRNAVHEMMHPPFRDITDSELTETLNTLKKDDFLMDKVLHHNPSYGYNSFEGFIEEDCVQALDQIINEKLDTADDARTRWRQNDDGMHVFAVALYQVMKDQQFGENRELFRNFLVRAIRSGKLGPGSIEPYNKQFYSGH